MARLSPGSWYYVIAVGVLVSLYATQVLLRFYNYDPYTLLELFGRKSLHNEFRCEEPRYSIRIVSYSPLVIHLENFITSQEAEHLITLGTPLLQPSFVFAKKDGDLSGKRSRERSSSSAFLRGPDPVVDCVRQRASRFQGLSGPLSHMETLQMVHYGPSEHFALHKDWGRLSPAGHERSTTFFGFLKAECKECGTHFPLLDLDLGNTGPEAREDWCRLVECPSSKNGTVFRALEGSAVFWRNLDDDGVGDERVLHAGLPPESGEKIGLNIWTRQGPG
ncbi:hypothetical protein N0V93_001968 [Gnomoniopsis smithogilvyi]|uniref:Prolyl 4-hydroxylase alpha subunit domain-containing protein n=1 Tax=Gnomoniopsis smithogilvyi TaxID=1191159 RepID=A0A9W8Z4Z1_9PEZI|nr:hypothetical protein N0V93_001968 [Gnomoniopsis smithogilvyi]